MLNYKKFFPVFRTRFKYPFTYLDNAASTQMCMPVLQKLQYFSKYHANIHRGVYALSIKNTEEYAKVREKVRNFINAKHSYECIFVKNTTEAINLVANSYGNTFIKNNDKILLTTMEHHSNIIPWQMLCKRVGSQIKVIPLIKDGSLNLNNLNYFITNQIKFIALTYVSNAIGTINNIKKIIKKAHEYNIPVLIDGAQAVAHIKIDVQDLDCDFFTFSSHKMYGPTGVGILYGKEKYLKIMEPYNVGGGMVLDVNFKKTIYKDLPEKFEAGTQTIANTIAFGKAIDFINSIGFDTILAHEKILTMYTLDKLKKLKIITTFGKKNENNRIGIILFSYKHLHSHDVASMLSEKNIAIRSGHLCAQPLLNFFKLDSAIRCSLGIYNDFTDIDTFYKTLIAIKKIFKL